MFIFCCTIVICTFHFDIVLASCLNGKLTTILIQVWDLNVCYNYYYSWVFLVFRIIDGFPTNPDGSWRYQCKSCLKFYKQRSGLYNHTKYDCGKEPSFPCTYCSYKAKHKANLKVHLSRKHHAELSIKDDW